MPWCYEYMSGNTKDAIRGSGGQKSLIDVIGWLPISQPRNPFSSMSEPNKGVLYHVNWIVSDVWIQQKRPERHTNNHPFRAQQITTLCPFLMFFLRL